MYTRSYYLGAVPPETYLAVKRSLFDAAACGSVSIYMHEKRDEEQIEVSLLFGLLSAKRRVPLPIQITVDVWSADKGSVDDYMEFFLPNLALRLLDPDGVLYALEAYRNRVAEWCGLPKSWGWGALRRA